MSQKHHGRALEMNRKEVGGSKANPSRTDSRRGCGLQADLCASPGVGGLVGVSGLIKTPGLGSMELVHVCSADPVCMGWLGLQPRLCKEFRGPLSRLFKEGSGFCIPGRIRPEG